jgi:hypothetical protein
VQFQDFNRPQRILGECNFNKACQAGLLQAILSDPKPLSKAEEAKGSCIAWASRRTVAPKLSVALIFWFFFIKKKEQNE